MQQRWRIETKVQGDDDDENKMWEGEKLRGNNDATQKWNLNCKCKKLGDNDTKKDKKTKSLNPKLEPKLEFWEMSILVLVLNLNLNQPNQVQLSPFKKNPRLGS